MNKKLDQWVRAVAARLGKNIRDAQVEMYVEEMEPWGLSGDELTRLERVVRRRSEGQWPNLAQLADYAKRVTKRPETEPVFRFKTDEKGRRWAKPSRYRKNVLPDEETMAEWQANQASPEDAQRAWNEGFFMVAGHFPEKKAEIARSFPAESRQKPEKPGVSVSPGAIIDIRPKKKYLTAENQPMQNAPHEPREPISDYDDSIPADSPDADDFSFSRLEIEYTDGDFNTDSEPSKSPFDDL
jgi:hypothetical protein